MIHSIATKVIQRSTPLLHKTFGFQTSRALSAFPPPRLFDYDTVTKNLTVSDAIDSVEKAFSALAKGKVDVPMPMHIGIEESDVAGPGDCHIKGGCKLCNLVYIMCIQILISSIHNIMISFDRCFGNSNLYCQTGTLISYCNSHTQRYTCYIYLVAHVIFASLDISTKACVSFYKNVEKNLPPGSGIFIVVNAITGAPLGVFQENRFMTDLR